MPASSSRRNITGFTEFADRRQLRLVQRLFAQISRILEINELTSVTKAAVETARESLIIGPP